MTIWNTHLTEEGENYLVDHSQLDVRTLDSVFLSANHFAEPHMQISKLQAANLQFLVRLFKASRILEVGTFVGFSVFSMALAAIKRAELGLTIKSIEIDPDHFSQASNNLKTLKSQFSKNAPIVEALQSIELIHDDAKNVLPNLTHDVDFFFLDGDKKNYSFYLDWAEKNLKQGAGFVIDNIYFKGGVLNPQDEYSLSIKEATERLKRNNLFDYCISPVGDCMLIATKR